MLALPLLVALPFAAAPQEVGQLLEPRGLALRDLLALDARDGRVAVSWLQGSTARVHLWSALPGTGDLALDAAFDGPTGVASSTTGQNAEVRLGPDGQVLHGVLGAAIHAYRPDGSGGWDLQVLDAPLPLTRRYGLDLDVDVDDRRMVVATEMFSLQAEYALAVYHLPPGADLWVLEDVITEPRTSGGGAQGLDVAIDAGRIVVGHQQGTGNTPGAVTLYRLDAGAIVRVGELERSSSVLDEFGSSVDIDGGHLLVGSRRANATGMVTAYRPQGSGWEAYQQFNHPAYQPFDRYARELALDGDLVVVSGQFVDGPSAAQGMADVRRFDGASWQPVTLLRDGIAAPGDAGASGFGRLVAADVRGGVARAVTVGRRDLLGAVSAFAWAEDVSGAPAADRAVRVTAGEPFCEPPANSTGATGRLRCLATSDVSATGFWGFTLVASGLPAQTFAIFTVADQLEPSPVGPFGLLCAGAPAPWRLSAPLLTDASGAVSAPASPFALPVGSASVVATAGSTWVFQTLARDGFGVTATTAVAVTFR